MLATLVYRKLKIYGILKLGLYGGLTFLTIWILQIMMCKYMNLDINEEKPVYSGLEILKEPLKFLIIWSVSYSPPRILGVLRVFYKAVSCFQGCKIE